MGRWGVAQTCLSQPMNTPLGTQVRYCAMRVMQARASREGGEPGLGRDRLPIVREKRSDARK